MTNEEWTDYATRVALAAHANGVREGFQRAAKFLLESHSFDSRHEIARRLLDMSAGTSLDWAKQP